MNKFLKYTLIIIVVLALLFFAYRWYSNKGLPKINFFVGSAPTPADIACASGGLPSNKMIIGSCTKPMVFPVPPGIKEKCFSSAQLGLNEGDSGYEIVTDNNGFGKKWYFNYQNGDRFCYTDKKI